MIKVIFGVFLMLHGLVHLLYFGQSARFFELKPGMVWPTGSWVLMKLLGDNPIHTLASFSCIIAAAGFVMAGAGTFLNQSWWRTVGVAAAAFSGVLYIIFWNGRFEFLDSQGGIGILIDLAILAAVLVFRWPQFNL